MHGRTRLIVALIGLLFFIAFVLGLVPIPTSAAFVGDGLVVAMVTLLFILAIVVVSLSGAISSARQMGRDPSARTTTAVLSTVVSALIGVGFVALVAAAILR